MRSSPGSTRRTSARAARPTSCPFPCCRPTPSRRIAGLWIGTRRAAGTTVRFPLPPGRRPHLGDIVISVERAIAQAEAGRGGQTGDIRSSPADELLLLATHGALHICGWDHAVPEEESAMRALERRLLQSTGPGSGP